jgi:hypothetical protein
MFFGLKIDPTVASEEYSEKRPIMIKNEHLDEIVSISFGKYT